MGKTVTTYLIDGDPKGTMQLTVIEEISELSASGRHSRVPMSR